MKKVNKSILALGAIMLLGATAAQAEWYNPKTWNWSFNKQNSKTQTKEKTTTKNGEVVKYKKEVKTQTVSQPAGMERREITTTTTTK